MLIIIFPLPSTMLFVGLFVCFFSLYHISIPTETTLNGGAKRDFIELDAFNLDL